MALTPQLLLMCGQEINTTLFPDSCSLISLPKHHSSFPTSVFQVSCVSPFWVITLPTVAGNFGKTDSDSSLRIWSQSDRGARGMWSSHCWGYTAPSHKSFLCLHTTANCSAQTERCYFSGQVAVIHTPELAVADQIWLAVLWVILTNFSLVVEEGSIQTLVSLKQLPIKLFKLGSHLLFVYIHRPVVRITSWNFSLYSLQSICQIWKNCDCGAFLDVLPFLSHRDCRWDKEMSLHHEMFLFMLYVLKGHSFCWASGVEVSFLQISVNCCSPETDTLLQISFQGDLWSALCNCSFLAGCSSLSFTSEKISQRL